MQLTDYFDFLSPDDIRIKGHRIGIDTVLEAFLNGFSPESIAADYPELSLEKIYATITYYYHRQTEVERYLQRLRQWREQRYQEALQNPSPMTERLQHLKVNRSSLSV
ncbi:MAG: DUF433 domain-containing protein [Leptolyngbyaceae cyanobacterium]